MCLCLHCFFNNPRMEKVFNPSLPHIWISISKCAYSSMYSTPEDGFFTPKQVSSVRHPTTTIFRTLWWGIYSVVIITIPWLFIMNLITVFNLLICIRKFEDSLQTESQLHEYKFVKIRQNITKNISYVIS